MRRRSRYWSGDFGQSDGALLLLITRRPIRGRYRTQPLPRFLRRVRLQDLKFRLPILKTSFKISLHRPRLDRSQTQISRRTSDTGHSGLECSHHRVSRRQASRYRGDVRRHP